MDTQPTGAQVDREIRKSRKIIDRLVGSRALSEDGLGWLVTALDPFHDTETRLEGYPDQISARSVCQCFQRKFTVTAPAAAAGGNWDAHIFYAPFSNPFPTSFGTHGIANGGQEIPVLAGFAAGFSQVPGGVTVTTGAANVPTWTSTSEPVVQAPAVGSEVIGCPVLQEGHRLLAVAYEVTNTTASLYRQGDVTVYKQPTMPAIGHIYRNQAATPFAVNQSAVCDFMSAPPRNAADCALYPNAKIWMAGDGVYAVMPMNDVEQKPARFRPHGFQYVFTQAAPSFGMNALGSSMSGTVGGINDCSVNTYPFDNVGSYFTGLSNQTTLTITARYIFERFPSLTADAEDSNFLTLATPSPSWDPVALELYGRVLSEMPPAVPVAENGLGEWFGKVVSWIGEAAPIVGKVVGNFVPGADAVGRMVGNIASGASSSMAASPSTKSIDYPKGVGAKAKKKPKKKK